MAASDLLKKCGAFVFTFGVDEPSIDEIVQTAQYAEELGFGSIQTAWHFTEGGEYILDPLVVAPILAQETDSIRISINSVILPTLHPAFWAEYFTNLDALSHGRVFPGLAVGALQTDFQVGEAVWKQRGRRFDEALEQFYNLLHGKPADAAGTYYDSTGLAVEPPARPDIEILIGGNTASIQRAAKWGNILNPIRCGAEQISTVLKPGLSEAAGAQNRSVRLAILQFAAIVLESDSDDWQQKYVWGPAQANVKDPTAPILGSPQKCAERVREQLEAGMDELYIEVDWHGKIPAGAAAREQLRRFAEEVVPLV